MCDLVIIEYAGPEKIAGQTEIQTDRQTDTQTRRQTLRQTGRQTDGDEKTIVKGKNIHKLYLWLEY